MIRTIWIPMRAETVSEAKTPESPMQFTLRQVAVWIVWISVALALLSQIGTGWGLALWIMLGVAVLEYAAYRSWYGFFAAGLVIAGIAVFCLMPTTYHPPSASRRSQCRYQLMQIGIALHNYHDAYGTFPPAYIADAQGRPMHSWRVLILPYVEEKSLYDRYDFSEPWDGPNNSKLAAEIPRIYRCPSDTRSISSTDTSYLAVVGDGTIWKGAKAVSLADVKDGSSNTLLVVESHGAGINWMEPRDLHTLQMPATVNPLNGQGICSCHNHKSNDRGRGECVQVLIADGSVRALENDTPSKTINALLTIAGGETVEFP